jgi:hypothetical protein
LLAAASEWAPAGSVLKKSRALALTIAERGGGVFF